MPRRSRSSEEAFSLFPFLAVLLCTMGTLTMIFVLVAQKSTKEDQNKIQGESTNTARFDPQIGSVVGAPSGQIIDAASLASALGKDLISTTRNTTEDDYARALTRVGALSLDEITGEQESLEWFLDELRNVRERTAHSLEEDRSRLADVEAALDRLRSESEVARRKYEALINSDESRVVGNDELQKQISDLDVEIERLQNEASVLREKNANLKRSYAIVPYQGKKGTFRRPIFVECNERGVFLQPEEIRFDERDFLLARYPGNPFDSALRAVSQHYIETGGQKTSDGDVVEPYPLIVVRPGGAEYFYPTIAALASWGDVYGYEFVDSDQKIIYPDPDPTLKELATRQANFARERLAAQLAQALASAQIRNGYGTRGTENASGGGTRASSSSRGSELGARLGSNVRLDAAQATLVSNGNGVASQNGVPSSNNLGNGLASRSLETNAAPLAASSPIPNVQSLGAFSSAAYSGAFSQYVVNSSADASNETNRADGKNGANVASTDAQGGQDSASVPMGSSEGALASSSSSQYVPNASASTETPAYMSAFQNPSESTPTDSTANVSARETLGNTSYAVGATGDSTEGVLARPQGSTRIEPVEKKTTSDMPKEAISLSKERRGATGNERGITARCSNSNYVFPKQPGLRYEITVSREPQKNREKQNAELLDVVTLCIKSWGVAGRDSYWAPFIKAEVESDGENAFRELSEFCQEQGLKLVRIDKK